MWYRKKFIKKNKLSPEKNKNNRAYFQITVGVFVFTKNKNKDGR